MSLPQFRAVLRGYADHLFDLKCLTVYAGFWAGYYNNTKRPKPLSTVLQKLVDSHLASKRKKSKNLQKPGVDVDEFIRREKQFQERLQRR